MNCEYRKIVIPGIPISQQRPRLGKWGVYDPQSDVKKMLKTKIIQQLNCKEIIKNPMVMEVFFFMPVLKSYSKDFIKTNYNRGMPKKPDIDNLLKFCLDLMNNLVYTDDSLITSIFCHKIYDRDPKTVILINPRSFTMEEHVLQYKKELLPQDLAYMAQKANALGYAGRAVHRVYTVKEDDDEYHLYFTVDPMRNK